VRLVWSPRAVRHLIALREYIAREKPDAANAVSGVILTSVERLGNLPNIGRPGRVAGTRELPITGTPYVIPYRVRGDRIEVLAVFHGRRKWPVRL
jgi:addiction module RelE/StbE family toxin